MALGSSDERDLIFPLFAGLQQADGWDGFLQRLIARTRASRICLLQRPVGAPAIHAFQREAWARRDSPRKPMGRKDNAPPRPLDVDALADSGLLPLHTLRPNRVYALEETRVLGDEAAAQRQARVLAREHIAHARFVRFVPARDTNAWLIVTHERKDFSAADSALLSAVVPYIALAITTLTQIMTLQLRATVAEEALALLGVGQVVLDRQARAVVADAVAEAELDVRAGSRPQMRAGSIEGWAAACEELAGASAKARRLVRLDERTGSTALMRPAPRVGDDLPKVAAATMLVRGERREDEASAARIAAAAYGLSAREAALAVALSRGLSLARAGEQLKLTQETARNYSKRIYAKTGASGQADLVRLLLTGLMPFA